MIADEISTNAEESSLPVALTSEHVHETSTLPAALNTKHVHETSTLPAALNSEHVHENLHPDNLTLININNFKININYDICNVSEIGK